MATATIGLGSKDLSVREFKADRKRALKAHARRVSVELGLHNANGTYQMPPLAPLPAKSLDVRSNPNGKPMKQSDIANVQFLNVDTAREILAEVGATSPEIAARALKHVEDEYRTLLTESERFVLSAMAARKYLREAVEI